MVDYIVLKIKANFNCNCIHKNSTFFLYIHSNKIITKFHDYHSALKEMCTAPYFSKVIEQFHPFNKYLLSFTYAPGGMWELLEITNFFFNSIYSEDEEAPMEICQSCKANKHLNVYKPNKAVDINHDKSISCLIWIASQ